MSLKPNNTRPSTRTTQTTSHSEKGVVEYAQEIEWYKSEINRLLNETESLIEDHARAETEQNKALARAEVELRDKFPVSILKDQAKDKSSEQIFNAIVAEKKLKAHFDKLDKYQACMNATQSQNRHLTES